VASTPAKLLTFAEYEQIPNPSGGRYELHHGELTQVGFPEHRHQRAQRQIRRLLERAVGDSGVVEKEMPYRPLPEYECWSADVAYLTNARWNSIERWLAGSPDLVVEVLSPSNTATEILDKKETCLQNGSREFWLVDLDHRLVEVSTPDGHTRTYKPGQEIPLFFGGRIAAEDIFV
jgi:Uma2 family endonuclease